MKYTVDYFIKKFELIPEHKWIKWQHKDCFGNGCALGHCGLDNNNTITKESAALEFLFLKELEDSVARINDHLSPRYNQETPKQRILAALHDIKRKQSEEQVGKTVKERVVYVAVDSEIRNNAKETIESQVEFS